ncbi:hydrolase, partial [Salmonella enterica subsp. enterica serovar Saintpaul]|nr:hydrolase [Salmonella enterica subsp. enterica serovar Saintpaul]
MTQNTAQTLTASITPPPAYENSPAQSYRATYSPDDNKLRLYAALRLDDETYQKIHAVGFRWAPKQELFVAPAWTPAREDVLLSLAGDIEDDDNTLFDRQEQRADRFSGYSEKRAVMLFERAEYWEERAHASLRLAKYKERPDVRYRRIRKIEADKRKAERNIAQAQKYLTMWRAQTLDLKMARLISNYDHIYTCFTLEKYPRPPEKSQHEGQMSLHSALENEIITFEQARDIAAPYHERTIRHQQRWLNHYQNRLAYERAMLDESGGVVTRTQDFEPGGQVQSRGEWLTIIRINKSGGAVSSVVTPYYSFMRCNGTMTLTPDRITDYKAPSAEEARAAKQAAKRPPIVNYPGEGFREMTKAEWSKTPADYKSVRGVAENDEHGAYRFRRIMT